MAKKLKLKKRKIDFKLIKRLRFLKEHAEFMVSISKLEEHWLFKKEIDLISRIVDVNKDVVVELLLLAIWDKLEGYNQCVMPASHKEIETKIHEILSIVNNQIVDKLNQEEIISKLNKLYRFVNKLALIYKEEIF